ncbi:MAG: hypothetical protein LBK47_01935 [Prevotellaceae bacterium]|jgi:predicted  nucleic acid-binding Zn-ribbon protein|nr:hypothetical protein [Prevotellaceae bacterium]
MEQQAEKNTNRKYVITILLLGLVLCGMIGWYAHEAGKWRNNEREMVAARDSIQKQLSNTLWEYGSLKTSNQSIKDELEVEKAKIQTLMKKMKTNEQISVTKIREYEKEANTLRAIMRSYIQQIDSLNTLNQQLVTENESVKQSLTQSKEENKKLTEEKASLTSQIEKGSVIKIRNAEVTGLNSRDKDTRYASRTRKIKACFTINENTIAKPGVRIAYIRIIAPDKSLLASAENGTFDTKIERLAYSAMREIDYQSSELETCIFFDTNNVKLPKGKYEIQVYMDGAMAGQGDFLLK